MSGTDAWVRRIVAAPFWCTQSKDDMKNSWVKDWKTAENVAHNLLISTTLRAGAISLRCRSREGEMFQSPDRERFYVGEDTRFHGAGRLMGPRRHGSPETSDDH